MGQGPPDRAGRHGRGRLKAGREPAPASRRVGLLLGRLRGLPALFVMLAGGRMPGQRGCAGGVKTVDGDGEEPLLDVAILVAGVGGRRVPGELLDQPGDIEGGDVGPQASVPVGAVDDGLVTVAAVPADANTSRAASSRRWSLRAPSAWRPRRRAVCSAMPLAYSFAERSAPVYFSGVIRSGKAGDAQCSW